MKAHGHKSLDALTVDPQFAVQRTHRIGRGDCGNPQNLFCGLLQCFLWRLRRKTADTSHRLIWRGAESRLWPDDWRLRGNRAITKRPDDLWAKSRIAAPMNDELTAQTPDDPGTVVTAERQMLEQVADARPPG